MMNVAEYDVLEEDDELEYTFQYSLLSTADQKSIAEQRSLRTHNKKSAQKNKISYPSSAEFLNLEEDDYPSDHFGLFDAILGIISLVVLFILFW